MPNINTQVGLAQRNGLLQEAQRRQQEAAQAARGQGTPYMAQLEALKAAQDPAAGWGKPRERTPYENAETGLQGFGMLGVPGLSDAAGLAGDAMMFARDPESRTPLNFGLSALGALPFVPALGGMAKAIPGRVLEESAEKLSQVPDVPQAYLPRYEPPRGQPASIQNLYDAENVERVQALARSGEQLGGRAWYNTEPLRLAAVDTLGDEAGNALHRAFMNRVAATSPRSTVADNIKRASYFQTRAAQGVPVDLLQQPPKPYGHLAHKTHAPMLRNLDEAGGFSSITQPKVASFADNLSGNQAPLTADAHFARAIGLQKASGAPELNAPSKTQYAGVEQFGQRMAEELGMTPAQFQASLWMGAAEETGVRNPQLFMQAFNDSLEKTAEARDITPVKALQKFLRGEAPLLGLTGAAAIAAEGLYGSDKDDMRGDDDA